MADAKLVAAIKEALADAHAAGACAGQTYGTCGDSECTTEADAQASEARVWALLDYVAPADDSDEARAEAWTRLYGDAALAQGWGLFQINGGGFEIQRDDEADVFEDDHAARAHVIAQAEAGDAGARGALDIETECGRLCRECGADLIGNEPHMPACEAAAEAGDA